MFCRSSLSSKTSNVLSFSGGTPWMSSTCTAAREKPHWGASGLPFMKSTTGVEETASRSFARASSLRNRRATKAADGESAVAGTRAGARRAANCRGCQEHVQTSDEAWRAYGGAEGCPEHGGSGESRQTWRSQTRTAVLTQGRSRPGC